MKIEKLGTIGIIVLLVISVLIASNALFTESVSAKTSENNNEYTKDVNGLSHIEIPYQNKIRIGKHIFNIKEGEPHIPIDLKQKSFNSDIGNYIIHFNGPIQNEWREYLENLGVKIIQYIPNYAYIVRMNPEIKPKINDLDFVDWLGIYHPDYKLVEDIKPGKIIIKLFPNTRIGPTYKYSTKFSIISRFDSSSVTVGDSILAKISDTSILNDIANIDNVYQISQYKKATIADEVGMQIVGGGCWVLEHDDDNDPTTPYRQTGDYGAYVNHLGYTGDGIRVGFADTGLGDGTTGSAGHSDFTGRVIGGMSYGPDPSDWSDGNAHGTHVAGLFIGDTYHGTDEQYAGFGPYYTGMGLAYDSDIFVQKFLDDADGAFNVPSRYIIPKDAVQNGVVIHSNSWGDKSYGDYTQTDQDYDRAVRDADDDSPGNQELCILAAAGNEGESLDKETNTRSPANGKNVIAVGATENYMPDSIDYGHLVSEDVGINPDKIADFSSRGWTLYDNRIKPDIVAPGQAILSQHSPDPSAGTLHGLYTPDNRYAWASGTSMAAPTAAGGATLIYEWYINTQGPPPSPAMIKALLINTAIPLKEDHRDDGIVDDYIPNKHEGWGRMYVPHVIDSEVPFELIDQNSLIETSEIDEYKVQYVDDSHPLKISLVWTDMYADIQGGLVNDLNLILEAPDGSTTYIGNAFDGDNDGYSDNGWTEPNVGCMDDFDENSDGYDDQNNVENIYIHPGQLQQGVYTVKIIGENVPADANNDGTANQDYALVMSNAASPAFMINNDDDYTTSRGVTLTVPQISSNMHFRNAGDSASWKTRILSPKLESNHPYDDYSTALYTIEDRGAQELEIHIEDMDMEDDYTPYDYLNIYDQSGWDSGTPVWQDTGIISHAEGGEWVTGISGDKAYIEIVPDGTLSGWGDGRDNPAWGFRIDQYKAKTVWSEPEPWSSPKSWTLSYGDGTKGVYCEQWDDNGQSYTMYDDIIYDGSHPSFSNFQPTGWWNSDKHPDCSVDISDSFRGIDVSTVKYRYSIDGGSSWENSWTSVDSVSGNDGDSQVTATEYNVPFNQDSTNQNIIKFRARDITGNLGYSSYYTVKVDTTDPTITITSPSDDAYIGSSSVDIQWSGSDGTSGIDHYEIQLNAGSWIDKGTSTSHTFTGLSDGSHTVRVRAYDNAGNYATDRVDFTVDTTAPTVDITSPQPNEAIGSTDVTIEWTATNGGSGIDYSEIRIDGGSWETPDSATSHQYNGLSEGEHTVDVRAFDNAGNVGSDSVTFEVDVTDPTDSSIDINGGDTYTNTRDVTLFLYATDSGSGVTEMRIGKGYTSNPADATWSDWMTYQETLPETLLNSEPDGDRYMFFLARDAAGNVGIYDDDSIILDRVNPETTPYLSGSGQVVDGEFWYTTDVDVYLESTDSLSGVYNTYYTIDDGSEQIGNSFTLTSDGIHTVEYYSEDNAGNEEAVDTITIRIDQNAPIVTVPIEADYEGGPDKDYDKDGEFVVYWTGDDNGIGIEKYELEEKIDNGAWNPITISDLATSINVNWGENGKTYYYHVRATDKLGHTSGWTFSSNGITVDTQAPSLITNLYSELGAYTEADDYQRVADSCDINIGQSINGSVLDTHAEDDIYHVIQETSPYGTPTGHDLEMKYTIPINPHGTLFQFRINAYTSGESFNVLYSVPGSPDKYGMFGIIQTSENDDYVEFAMNPNIVKGHDEVLIWIEDTVDPPNDPDRDVLNIDHMEIIENIPDHYPVILSWELSPDDGAGDDDVDHYNIYRTTTFDTGYTLIDTVDAGTSTWTDMETGYEGDTNDYFYAVGAVDHLGNLAINNQEIATKYNLELHDGDNFISLPSKPRDTNITKVMKTIINENDVSNSDLKKAMYYDVKTDDWKTYEPGRKWKYNDFYDIDQTMGTWIDLRMNSDAVLMVTGRINQLEEIKLYGDPSGQWNMVGYPCMHMGNNNLPSEVEKIGYPDPTAEYGVSYSYTPESFEFETGKGYWLYTTADVTWFITDNMPDLNAIPSNIELAGGTESLNEGDSLTFTVPVFNTGYTTLSDLYVRAYATSDIYHIGNETISSIEPKSRINLTFNWDNIPGGEHTIYVVVDNDTDPSNGYLSASTKTINVNYAPRPDIHIYRDLKVTLGIKGRKDNTVTCIIYENGIPIKSMNVTRTTGKPNTITEPLEIYKGRNYTMDLIYNATHRGANPVGVLLWSEEGSFKLVRDVFKTVDGFDQRKSYYLEKALSKALRSENLYHFSALGSYDPDGEIVSYHWDFGDGSNATGMYVDHEYSEAGEYVVTLTVTDDDGTVSTVEYLIVVDRGCHPPPFQRWDYC
ncbi:MAG: S8 family serine peptidase [Thermoplasmata archaeon]